MTIVHGNLKRQVHHRGYAARTETPDYSSGYHVLVGETKIGEFVFSDGHDGYAGFSNSYGIDCYRIIERCGQPAWGCGPLYHSRRNVVKDLIDYAVDNGALESKTEEV